MSIQIKNLLTWNNRAAGAMNSTPFWMNLVRVFGTELLYFLIDKEYANQIPETTAALKKFKTQITEWNGRKPKHGSVWILFAFRENLLNLPAPFRKDGILLPFEWRTREDVTQHSPLLPQGLIELADKVKQQFGEKAEKYYLYPDSIFGDRVNFSMDGVGFSSGWGALVSGLYLALNPKAMLLEWPFSSIQYDCEKGEMDAVGHLEEKIKLAASFNAEEFAVAPCQYKESIKALNVTKAKYPENKKIQKMKIFMVKSAGSVEKTAANIVKCNQHNKQRLIRNICFAHAAVLLLLAVAAGVLYWDNNRDYVVYYADYVMNNSIPEGIFKLDEAQIKNKHCHYQFTYKGQKSIFGERILQKVMLCNSSGSYIECFKNQHLFDHPSHMRINKGELDIIDIKGRVLERRKLSGGEKAITIEFKNVDKETGETNKYQAASMFSSPLIPLQSKSRITHWRIDKKNSGGDSKKLFFYSGNRKVKNADNVYGVELHYDSFKRIKEIFYLDENGNRCLTSKGIASTAYEYDSGSAALLAIVTKDFKGEFLRYTHDKFDEYGNIKSRSVYCRGERSYNLHGAFQEQFEYKNGNIEIVRYLGTDGRLSINAFGYAKKYAEYNNKLGYESLAIFYGTDGKPCINADGCSKVVTDYRFGKDLLIITQIFYGKDLKTPCMNKEGFSKVLKFSWKNIEHTNFFNFNEKENKFERCNNTAGIHSITKIYDPTTNSLLEESYWNSELDAAAVVCSPILPADKAYLMNIHKIKYDYDPYGNLESTTFFNTGDVQALNVDFYAKSVNKYTDDGRLKEQRFYGLNDGKVDKPCETLYKFGKITYEYDKNNIIYEFYDGTHEKKCTKENLGFTKIFSKYDDNGRLIEQYYYEFTGRDYIPCAPPNLGYARMTAKYDERGRMIERNYYNFNGKTYIPCVPPKLGYARTTVKYDEYGRMIEQNYYNFTGKTYIPCAPLNLGHARMTAKYDERGRMIEQNYYNFTGKTYAPKKTGCAHTRAKYDDFSRMAEQIFYTFDFKILRHQRQVSKIKLLFPANTDAQSGDIILNESDNRHDDIVITHLFTHKDYSGARKYTVARKLYDGTYKIFDLPISYGMVCDYEFIDFAEYRKIKQAYEKHRRSKLK